MKMCIFSLALHPALQIILGTCLYECRVTALRWVQSCYLVEIMKLAEYFPVVCLASRTMSSRPLCDLSKICFQGILPVLV